jgi:hypothetical protein
MSARLRPWVLVAVVAASAAAAVAIASAALPTLHFEVFAKTGIRLTDIAWTGKEFLYVENTTNTVFAAPPAGLPTRPFASMPKVTEETRSLVSPGAHGWPAGDIYCHSPDNKIYRLSPDGKNVTVFASLHNKTTSDGGLAFDTVGRFGYRLVAATGRSGNPQPAGGVVYTIDRAGSVRKVGTYPGPGGSDELVIAPAKFGSVGGWAIVDPDPGQKGGSVVAVSPGGQTRTLATLPTGPNPIAVVGETGGFYVTDTNTRNVYLVRAGQLAQFRGDLILGAEIQARFWILRPRGGGGGFQLLELKHDLPSAQYNFEGGRFLAR